ELESLINGNTIKNFASGDFTSDGLIEVVGIAGNSTADADAANTLKLDNDTLANTGTVLVENAARLQLTDATTIDNTSGGTITNHGEIESVLGLNVISNAANFTSDGLIEVVGIPGNSTADADAANTLRLDNDTLDNTGIVLVENAARLQLTDATTIDNTSGGTITNHGEIES